MFCKASLWVKFFLFRDEKPENTKATHSFILVRILTLQTNYIFFFSKPAFV